MKTKMDLIHYTRAMNSTKKYMGYKRVVERANVSDKMKGVACMLTIFSSECK